MTLIEIIHLLGSLGEFLGAIAVFATLLYLAIQVREASRTAQFAAVEANRSRRIAAFTALRDSPYLPAILVKLQAGEELNTEEQIRVRSHDAAQWALAYAEWVQRELGVMGEFATNDEAPMEVVLGSSSAMVFWQIAGVRLYPARFVEYVNQMVAAREEGDSASSDTMATLFTDTSPMT